MPETMRLTLNAAETGHLVHHDGPFVFGRRGAGPGRRRRFPAEIQGGICAQLADCLAGVVCQRLRYRAGSRRCASPSARSWCPPPACAGTIRAGQFSRLATALEGGGQEGQWTWARYRELGRCADRLGFSPCAQPGVGRRRVRVGATSAPRSRGPPAAPSRTEAAEPAEATRAPAPVARRPLVIDDVDEDPASILEKLGRK